MSLARTALRWAAIRALETHPTIAQACPGRVYGSRVNDFNHREMVPIIVVTTEELSGEAVNPQNGGLPFFDACDLVLEVMQQQYVEPEDGEPFLFRPETDEEMEAALETLTWCAEQVLTTGKAHPLARAMTPEGRLLVRAVTRRVSKRTASRFSSDDTGERLAIHLVTFRVELKNEDIDFRHLPTGEFAALPDPLRTVAESLPEDHEGRLTCRMIAARLGLALTPPAAQSLDPTPPDPLPLPGTLPIAGALPIPSEP